jgi:hypothetical protein
MTVSFNVMLFQSSMSRNARGKWWIAGNLGFLDRAAIGIVILVITELLLAYLTRRPDDPNVIPDVIEHASFDADRQSR